MCRVIAPFAEARNRLDAITGVGKRAAECIIAEIGTDMSRLPGAPLASAIRGWHGATPPRSRISTANPRPCANYRYAANVSQSAGSPLP